MIDTPKNGTEQWLVDMVARQAREVGIGMPEVGILIMPSPTHLLLAGIKIRH